MDVGRRKCKGRLLLKRQKSLGFRTVRMGEGKNGGREEWTKRRMADRKNDFGCFDGGQKNERKE
uniref:Uncharacterized protein n=1 Tax=Cucumis melo TaxID=3656 RepID=A0A9I9D3B4_CUCME